MEKYNIQAEKIELGINVRIEETAIIRGVSGLAKNIKLGDNVYIGHDVQIICDHFELGDYSKIHHHTNIHGYLPCRIGHNAWIGQYSIIDSIGGVEIGNNCGIGAHSQLWSHIKFGDRLEGCQFLSQTPMIIGDDVWFVGHCIVHPVNAEDKSMAMAGSVITKNMKYNTIYAGTPATEISSKIGFQFIERSINEKMLIMQELLLESGVESRNIRLVEKLEYFDFSDEVTYFEVGTRLYTKKRTKEEIEFMKYLLPEKAKFVPYVMEER
jgi:acetyltransferase-like isoleucine patch superfamily enzyme